MVIGVNLVHVLLTLDYVVQEHKQELVLALLVVELVQDLQHKHALLNVILLQFVIKICAV